MERFWIRWLYGAAALTTLGGLWIAFFTGTPVMAALEDPIRAVFWEGGRMDPGTAAFQRFVFGLAGAVMAGWGLCLLLLVHHALARGQRWAWWALALSLDLWYLCDTAISAYYGVWINVALNTFFLVLFAVPLLGMRRSLFSDQRTPGAAAASMP
jgi:hypothetical protein